MTQVDELVFILDERFKLILDVAESKLNVKKKEITNGVKLCVVGLTLQL